MNIKNTLTYRNVAKGMSRLAVCVLPLHGSTSRFMALPQRLETPGFIGDVDAETRIPRPPSYTAPVVHGPGPCRRRMQSRKVVRRLRLLAESVSVAKVNSSRFFRCFGGSQLCGKRFLSIEFLALQSRKTGKEDMAQDTVVSVATGSFGSRLARADGICQTPSSRDAGRPIRVHPGSPAKGNKGENVKPNAGAVRPLQEITRETPECSYAKRAHRGDVLNETNESLPARAPSRGVPGRGSRKNPKREEYLRCLRE